MPLSNEHFQLMDELSPRQIVGKALTVHSPNNGPAISGHSNKRTSYFSQNEDLS